MQVESKGQIKSTAEVKVSACSVSGVRSEGVGLQCRASRPPPALPRNWTFGRFPPTCQTIAGQHARAPPDAPSHFYYFVMLLTPCRINRRNLFRQIFPCIVLGGTNPAAFPKGLPPHPRVIHISNSANKGIFLKCNRHMFTFLTGLQLEDI